MSSPAQLRFLAGLALFGAVIRFATLDAQSYHHDEAVTAGRILLPNLFDTMELVGDSERSPPLYYLLAWGWSTLFGTGEIGLRSLSALIGTLIIPAAYLAGHELAGRRAESAARIGLYMAAFVALNPYLVWYSQEARSYILMALFATIALAFFARSLREPSSRSLFLWALSSALALASHYFYAFLIVPQLAWLLWHGRDRVRALAPALAVLGVVIVALIPLARAQQGDERRDGFTDTALSVRVGEVALDFVASEEPPPLSGPTRVDGIQIGAAVIGGVLMLAAIAMVIRRATAAEQGGAAIAAALAMAAIVVPIVLALAGLDLFNPRNLIGALIPILGFVAIGFGAAGSGSVGRAAAAATFVLFGAVVIAVAVSEGMHRVNWRDAAEAMGQSDRPRLIVTNKNGDNPLIYYRGAAKLRRGSYPSGIEVNEIQVLTTVPKLRIPDGFQNAGEQRIPPFFLIRLESERPRRLNAAELTDVIDERHEVMVDAGGG